jgi:hypothetical protein
MAVFAPIPIARDSTMTAVSAGARRMARRAYRKSCIAISKLILSILAVIFGNRQ